MNNKSSAVAEMDHRGHNRHGPKIGSCCAAFAGGGGLGPPLTQGGMAEAHFSTKWHLDPSSRLATIDMGQKLEAGPLLGELGTHLTQRRLVEAYLLNKWHLDHQAVWPQ